MYKMTNQLRDEYIGHFAKQCKSDKFWDICRGISEPIIAFYENQIDAQAKTMEELWEIVKKYENEYPINEKASEWAKNNMPSESTITRNIFSCYIGFFLAAGGMIKADK